MLFSGNLWYSNAGIDFRFRKADYGGDLWEVSIVRPHTQSYKEMLTLVAAVTEPGKIADLNQSDTLLWE